MLAKHLDKKTFAERWVVDLDDLAGLRKVLSVAVEHHRNDKFYLLFLGAKLILDILFQETSIDTWPKVLLEFNQALGIYDNPEHFIETYEGAYDE